MATVTIPRSMFKVPGSCSGFRFATCALLAVALVLVTHLPARAQALPELTQPVNDFANVIDPSSAQAMDSLIRSLQRATGDVVVVATVRTFKPFGSIEEFANRLFENHGRGIGEKGKDNGLLVVAAMDDRRIQIEVGYDLEQFIPDGYAGETIRQVISPEFRQGNYGAGLMAGVSRIAGRIAERRGVTLQGVPATRRRDLRPESGSGNMLLVALFLGFIILNAIAGSLRGRGRRGRYGRRWGGGGWSGWSSGVGPFGGGGFGGRGGFGGGGGGGFGGGFGGFGGGRSGGGGGGGSW